MLGGTETLVEVAPAQQFVVLADVDIEGATSAAASASFSLAGPQLSVRGIGSTRSPVMMIVVTGTAQAPIELVVDGTSQGIRTINGAGKYNYIAILGNGTHDIAVRYADGSGRIGPATHLTVSVAV